MGGAARHARHGCGLGEVGLSRREGRRTAGSLFRGAVQRLPVPRRREGQESGKPPGKAFLPAAFFLRQEKMPYPGASVEGGDDARMHGISEAEAKKRAARGSLGRSFF